MLDLPSHREKVQWTFRDPALFWARIILNYLLRVPLPTQTQVTMSGESVNLLITVSIETEHLEPFLPLFFFSTVYLYLILERVNTNGGEGRGRGSLKQAPRSAKSLMRGLDLTTLGS